MSDEVTRAENARLTALLNAAGDAHAERLHEASMLAQHMGLHADALAVERLAEALAAERAAGRAEGARQMRERAAAAASRSALRCRGARYDAGGELLESVAGDIEALPLDEATS